MTPAGGRTVMKNLLPPKLLLLAILLMVLLHLSLPIASIPAFPLNWIGAVMLLTGLSITVWGSNKFQKVGTNIRTFDSPRKLVTDGLFQYSRNPMYLGFSVAVVGVALMLGSFSPLLVSLLFMLIVDRWYIAYEERMMLETFGNEYRQYCLRVRRWL